MNKPHLYTLLLLFFCTQTAFATTVEIQGLKPAKLEGKFLLLNKSKHISASLDCASFIHNMEITNGKKKHIFHLSEKECLEDFKYLKKTGAEKRCLNFTEYEYYLNSCS